MQRKVSEPGRKRAYRLEEVLDTVRLRILRGEFSPGSRFPTQGELMKELRIGKTTAQRLFNILAGDGYIIPQGASGTFVTENPPHLSRYGIIFPYSEENTRNSYFYQGMQYQCRLLEAEGVGVYVFYYQPYLVGSRDYAQLLEDMRRHRLAGLIFATDTGPMAGTEIPSIPGIPKVAITSDTTYHAGISTVYPDLPAFMRRAVAYLAQIDRRRIAHISPPRPEGTFRFNEALPRHALITRHYWQLEVDPKQPSPARNIAHCLMRLPPDDRPDGLIISDDHLVEDAMAGLIDAGVRVPEDVTVVAHANFPLCRVSPLPIQWIGFDLADLLRWCMHAILLMRQGDAQPHRGLIPAITYAEYTAARRSAPSQPSHPSLLKGAPK